ncbi:hypothetical protein PBV87_15385 [Niameybacter massiliensis]|uniref:Uncharacterized protein n=1 Tax=Holtiella tumoricola TaxID=3018743 RepID=A0AA42J1T4_9FIRM|nr:hypothetical protein [Holtiella tumoricola]MDA3732859.1 hypothetical protein [Holtiella tumoricola]
MYLGRNGKLYTYGILEMDLWVLQGLRDMDKVEVNIDVEWTEARFRNESGRCWLESRNEAGKVIASGCDLERMPVRI